MRASTPWRFYRGVVVVAIDMQADARKLAPWEPDAETARSGIDEDFWRTLEDAGGRWKTLEDA